MVRATGQDPALVGLLRVYKDYYPEIIVGNAASGRTSFASAAQDEWRQRLQAIQEAHAERNEQLHIPRHGFQVIRRGAKRAKASILPDVRTSYANEKSVTLEEINSADDLVKHLERIELPNQLLASLKDPLLQKYLILNPSNTATRRLELWLESFLREVLDAATSGVVLPEHCDELLDGMLNYTRATKVRNLVCNSQELSNGTRYYSPQARTFSGHFFLYGTAGCIQNPSLVCWHLCQCRTSKVSAAAALKDNH